MDALYLFVSVQRSARRMCVCLDRVLRRRKLSRAFRLTPEPVRRPEGRATDGSQMGQDGEADEENRVRKKKALAFWQLACFFSHAAKKGAKMKK